MNSASAIAITERASSSSRQYEGGPIPPRPPAPTGVDAGAVSGRRWCPQPHPEGAVSRSTHVPLRDDPTTGALADAPIRGTSNCRLPSHPQPAECGPRVHVRSPHASRCELVGVAPQPHAEGPDAHSPHPPLLLSPTLIAQPQTVSVLVPLPRNVRRAPTAQPPHRSLPSPPTFRHHTSLPQWSARHRRGLLTATLHGATACQGRRPTPKRKRRG